jgi:hypothetical protein
VQASFTNGGPFLQRVVPCGTRVTASINHTYFNGGIHTHGVRYRAANTAEIDSSSIRTVENGKLTRGTARYLNATLLSFSVNNFGNKYMRWNLPRERHDDDDDDDYYYYYYYYGPQVFF